jgi:hypothetical protein
MISKRSDDLHYDPVMDSSDLKRVRPLHNLREAFRKTKLVVLDHNRSRETFAVDMDGTVRGDKPHFSAYKGISGCGGIAE